MFNFLKALLAVSFIKSNKKKLLLLVFSLIMIVLTIFISDDLFKVVTKENKSLVLLIKWCVIVIFTIVSFIAIKYMIKTNIGLTQNTSNANKHKTNYRHKSNVLKETEFESKGDSIINKYRTK